MEPRKPYQRPVLQAYGDIRAITAQINKTFGAGDSMVFFESQDILETIS